MTVISTRIRGRRKARSLSLRALGERTGLTAGFLSQIENDRVRPSLASLQRIATALDVPMLYFLGEDGVPPGPVVRAGERRRLYFSDSRIGYDLLTPDTSGTFMSVQIRIAPGARRVADRLARPTEEWMYVLQGRLEIRIGAVTHLLDPGDTVYYAGEALREFACVGDQETRVLCCVAPPVL